MAHVSVTKTIDVDAQTVWARLSPFSGIEEFSPIERSVVTGSGAGAKRSCYMPDGAEIKEVLNVLDHDNMHLEYAILEGPFPINHYVSTIDIKAIDGDRSSVTWACNYEVSEEHATEMENLFAGFYNVMISNLEGILQA